ncbi:MAG: hypothetical protein JNK05_39830 [Myxococcales bacterium]|jgi:hypothetical protein|nr:hypothetical protein [Myxococcales bacterium]
MAVQHAIFAMELCLPLTGVSGTHSTLVSMLREYPLQSTADEKWHFYERVRQLLLSELPHAYKGCWDFFNEDARAKSDFEMWTNGMLTREGARSGPSGRPEGDPFRGGANSRFMTVTIAWLMVQSMPSTIDLSMTCNIPESALWHRSSFGYILSRMGRVQFSAVKSDVFYVIPGDDAWGLTVEDLQLEKFHYLRPIQG